MDSKDISFLSILCMLLVIASHVEGQDIASTRTQRRGKMKYGKAVPPYKYKTLGRDALTTGNPIVKKTFAFSESKLRCHVSTCNVDGKRKLGVECIRPRNVPEYTTLKKMLGNRSIDCLTLSDVTFNRLTDASFVKFSNLLSLKFTARSDFSFHADAFYGLSKLSHLRFVVNHVLLPEQIFTPLTSLKSLDLTDCWLQEENVNKSLCGLSPTMKVLILKHVFHYTTSHSFTQLDNNMFACLSKLKINLLSLENNRITRLSIDVANNIRHITCLNVRSNIIMGDILAIYRLFISKQALILLDAGHQQIFPGLPLRSHYFPTARELCYGTLHFSGYGDTIINQSHPKIHSSWQISSTEVNRCPEGMICILRRLKALRLDHALAAPLPLAISNLPICIQSLEYLDMSGTPFAPSKGEMPCLQRLRVLNLRNTVFSSVSPYLLNTTSSLEVLLMKNSTLFSKVAMTELFRKNIHLKILELSKLSLSSLKTGTFQSQFKLEELYLNDNSLTNLGIIFGNMSSIKKIDLSGNKFKTISLRNMLDLNTIQRNRNQSRISVNLLLNPIECSCANIEVLLQLVSTSLHIEGLHDKRNPLTCINSSQDVVPLAEEVENTRLRCQSMSEANFWSLCIVYPMIILAMVIGSVTVRNIWKVRYWMLVARYTLFRKHLIATENKQYQFDVFFAYASEDDMFVMSVLESLEQTENPYSVCISQRNFRPGVAISDNIVSAITKSKTCILFISSRFLSSGWCEFEARFAHAHALQWNKNNVIAVVHPSVVTRGRSNLPLSLIGLLETVTYLNWPLKPIQYDVFMLKLHQSIGAPSAVPGNTIFVV